MTDRAHQTKKETSKSLTPAEKKKSEKINQDVLGKRKNSDIETRAKSNFQRVMWSGDNQLARTPPEVWTWLNEQFGTGVGKQLFDPCPVNPQIDGMTIKWKSPSYINPPYNLCSQWVQKTVQEAVSGNECIMLIPCRTNTCWFHQFVLPYAETIYLVMNGIKFVGYKRKSPFAVCFVKYTQKSATEKKGNPIIKSVDFYH